MRSSSMILFIFLFLAFLIPVKSSRAELKRIMEKVRNDLFELASTVESEYDNRCKDETLLQCGKNNYDSCLAEYPNPSCIGGNLSMKKCGDGTTCGSKFDYSTSTVRIPEALAEEKNNNPTDKEIIESVCFTQNVGEWMREKYENESEYWKLRGADPPSSYFGAVNGMFRIYPAAPSEKCGEYDARFRPWYIAAASGKKDVILILDTSGSVDEDLLDLMKEAAMTVINTTSKNDRVAVIEAKANPRQVGFSNSLLVEGNTENKEKLITSIDNLQAMGRANFYESFRLAYDILNNSVDEEQSRGCNAAILFFTDGDMNYPPGVTEDNLIDLITRRKAIFETSQGGKPVTTFTYSIGRSSVNDFLRRIACATNGIWTKIDNKHTLIDRMSSYYRMFAIGLGAHENRKFSTWAEPYIFATGGWPGTTVSAPVYDRSVEPHVFLGVVGIDITLYAMGQTLGESCRDTFTCDETIKEIELLSNAEQCQQLNLTLCELETLRRYAGGIDAVCTSECAESDFSGFVPEQCTSDNHPQDLWSNVRNKGKDYFDRACCLDGENINPTLDKCFPQTNPNEERNPKEGQNAKEGQKSNGGLIISFLEILPNRGSEERKYSIYSPQYMSV